MLAIAVAAGLAGADVSPAQTAPDAPRVVIEMFTSQGCSSCPPADALLGELAKRRDVVAISLPVDYWDYLGWKDTLADKSFSDRQKLYGKSRGDRQVYTPQAVINGAAHAVGSDRIAIDSAIRVAQPLSVPVKLTRRDGGLRVEIGAAAASGWFRNWPGARWRSAGARTAGVRSAMSMWRAR